MKDWETDIIYGGLDFEDFDKWPLVFQLEKAIRDLRWHGYYDKANLDTATNMTDDINYLIKLRTLPLEKELDRVYALVEVLYSSGDYSGRSEKIIREILKFKE